MEVEKTKSNGWLIGGLIALFVGIALVAYLLLKKPATVTKKTTGTSTKGNPIDQAASIGTIGLGLWDKISGAIKTAKGGGTSSGGGSSNGGGGGKTSGGSSSGGGSGGGGSSNNGGDSTNDNSAENQPTDDTYVPDELDAEIAAQDEQDALDTSDQPTDDTYVPDELDAEIAAQDEQDATGGDNSDNGGD